jgi:hypothetical protein
MFIRWRAQTAEDAAAGGPRALPSGARLGGTAADEALRGDDHDPLDRDLRVEPGPKPLGTWTPTGHLDLPTAG